MIDFKKMYFRLFNYVTDAIEMLQEAQRDCEAAYVESEPDIRLHSPRLHEPDGPKAEPPEAE